MKPIAIDTETFCITRENPSPKNVCLSWCDGEYSDIIPHGQELIDQLYEWMIDEDILFVGHNIAFDFCSLCTSYPDITEYVFALYKDLRVTDTGIRQQLFDIAVGKTYTDDKIGRYSLASLYETIFNKRAPNFESKIKENPNSWRLRYSELYNVPIKKWPKDAISYAIQDSEITFDIYEAQNEAKDFFRDDCFQAYSAFCLNWISLNGMKTSPSKVVLFKKQQQKIYESYIEKLSKHGLLTVNKDGSYRKKILPAQQRIFDACKKINREPFLTKKGEKLSAENKLDNTLKYIATDKKAVYWSEDLIMKDRLKFVETEKILSTYLPVLSKGYEFPITSRFDLAATGRTTSSAPREPLVGTNLQNWPRETTARNCFVPRKNRIFLAGDFSGAELHTLAQSCKYLVGYSVLGDKLNENLDVHLQVAANILGISYEKSLKRKIKNDEEINKYRFYAKMANFGFSGGMSPNTWRWNQLEKTGILFSLEFATKLRNNWMKTWPEMSKYFRHTSRLLENNFGGCTIEQFYSNRLRYVDKYTVLNNTWFQGLTADGSKKAICAVINKCYTDQESYLYGCRPVNFIHDELILEIPYFKVGEERNKIIREFKKTMEDEFNEVVPDYPTTVDVVLMDCWNKKAEEILDDHGNWRVYHDDN